VFDEDVISEQAHPDVLAHELGGHSIVLSPQGDGGIWTHQAADLHLQQLSEFSGGGTAGGLVAMSRGPISQAGVFAALAVAPLIGELTEPGLREWLPQPRAAASSLSGMLGPDWREHLATEQP